MRRRPRRTTQGRSSAGSEVYKSQPQAQRDVKTSLAAAELAIPAHRLTNPSSYQRFQLTPTTLELHREFQLTPTTLVFQCELQLTPTVHLPERPRPMPKGRWVLVLAEGYSPHSRRWTSAHLAALEPTAAEGQTSRTAQKRRGTRTCSAAGGTLCIFVK